MPLDEVRIESLRCLTGVAVALHPERNYLYGPNGAGKTSFLEAVYLLSRGRSFRTRQSKQLVQRGASALSVYGELRDDVGALRRIGVEAGAGGLVIRIDRAPARGIAELASLVCVDVIDPSIHDLVEGAPSGRRRFLDWGVFHVEHRFLDAWRRYARVLAQRNAALKAADGPALLAGWDEGFVGAALEVDAYRRAHADRLRPLLESISLRLIGAPVVLAYDPGWRPDLGLREALRSSARRDELTGFTQVGPHRADLRLTVDGRPLAGEASRGQQKLVAASLVVAQVRALPVPAGGAGRTLLVDDPAAELDAGSLTRLLAVLRETPSQLVFTGLSPRQLEPESDAAVFHVEQGTVERWYNAAV